MNDRRENQLSMLVAVKAVVADNQSAWQTLPAFVTSVAELDSGIETVRSLVQISSSSTKGMTETKRIAKQLMIGKALVVAGAVQAFAEKTGNSELFARVSYTPSKLRRTRDTEVSPLCEGIHDAADDVVADLADYGVAAEDLTMLATLIETYDSCVGKPRMARSEFSAAGTLLNVQLDSAMRLVDRRLDGIMERYRVAQPSFFESYVNARRIVDTGSRNGHNGNGANGNGTPPPPTP